MNGTYGLTPLWDRFYQVADASPAEMALCGPNCELSYEQLLSEVDDLARRLSREGLLSGQRVAVSGVASPDFVVTLLAILKLGAAYVPLHAQDPSDRQRAIVADCEPALVIEVPSASDGGVARWSDRLTRCAEPGRAQPASDGLRGDSAAYVMYTSGSTGRPKGVVIPHRGILRLVVDPDWVCLNRSTRTIALAPTAFDASTFEIWAPLLNGGTLVLPEPGHRSLRSLVADIAGYKVTHLWLPAGLLSLVVDHHLDAMAGLRFLIAGGDILSPRHVERAAETLASCQVANGYGPTENTTFSTVYLVPPGKTFDRSVPIGKAISGTTLRILDEDLNPAQPGVGGQLAVGGAGLFVGYLGDPELTSRKLIKDPADPASEAKVFLTGDYVEPLADGNLSFIGRLDGQNKIRGHRVECSEIESVLLRDPRVGQAVVLADGADGHRRLAAFAVPAVGKRLTPEGLHDLFSARLPDYMVPSLLQILPSLPLTRNGKIDRDRLLGRRAGPAPARRVAPPATELERRLINVFQTVLGTAPIGANDNFMDLGGDSLAALELAETIYVLFDVDLDPHYLLELGTPAAISDSLRNRGTAFDSFLIPLQSRGSLPPFFCVHGGGGEVLFLAGIRRHLSGERPFFGLRPPGLNDEAPILRSVQAYAELYASVIQDAYPAGPCVIGGLCFGGNIAVETARLLRDEGREVEAVVLFDTVYPGSGWPIVQEIVRYTVPKWLRFVRTQLQRRGGTVKGSRQPARPWSLYAGPIGRVEWAILLSVLTYRPAEYNGSMAAFLGDGNDFRGHRLDPRLAWIRIAANGLAVRHVKGRRSKMFAGDNARALARTLETFLRGLEWIPDDVG